MEQNVVLEMHDISKNFTGVRALSHVDFTLRKGEIHALMGENGAGKSTLIKVLTGVHEFESGTIHMAGNSNAIINHSPQEAQANGISTVYQEVNLCPNLTVAENLFIGREPRKMGMIDWKQMNERSGKLLESLDIHVPPTQMLEECSIAIQQMIAIARAVDMKCQVLILDEPTSSLDDDEVEKLFVLMRRLRDEGVGIIFVTHFLEQCSPRILSPSSPFSARITSNFSSRKEERISRFSSLSSTTRIFLFAGASPGSNSLTLSESFLILRFYSLQTYSNGTVINKNISGYLRRRRLKFIDDLFILLMSLKVTGQMYYSRFLSEISTI